MHAVIKTTLATLALAVSLGAQSTDSFDDVARRAEAALDAHPLEAALLFRQALALRPAWAEGWLDLGMASFQTRRFGEASDAFRRGVELAPGIGSAWGFLGMTEANLGDGDQALSDIRRGEALGLGPNPQFELAVRTTAARLLIAKQAFDEALSQLVPLLRLNVPPAAVERVMGQCALAEPRAYETLPPERRAVIDMAGRPAWAAVSRRAADAAAGYDALLVRFPEEPGVHYARGLFLMESNRGAALAEFQREVELNPGHWPARIVIATLLLKGGEAERAIATLNEAMRMVPAPFRWIGHGELGRAYMNLDQLDRAVKELEIAVHQRRDNAQLTFLLAQAYRQAGRKADAERTDAEFKRLKAQQDPLSLTGGAPKP